MPDFDDSFLAWVWRGMALAGGFIAASALVGGVLFFAVAGSFRASDAASLWPSTQQHVPTSMPRPTEHRVYVEPRSREQCLELTGGVTNERYARCRQGHWTTE